MKLDIVVGNPPYNNDIYLEFAQLGFKLKANGGQMLLITPAKWQAKRDIKNKRFRDTIVPYMSNVVVFKDSTDIFNIKEWGGISYYLVGTDKQSTINIRCSCSKNKAFESDTETRGNTDLILLPNKILPIINKCATSNRISDNMDFRRCIYVGEQERGLNTPPELDSIPVMQGEKHTGYVLKSNLYTDKNLEKWKCICSIMPGSVASFDYSNKVLGMYKISIIGPNSVPKGSFPIMRYFDTKEECESFVSFCNSKLISFLYYIGTCGTTLTTEFWRFVPDQEEYNHIFTDSELYAKYNIDNSEIEIIESVIKDRNVEPRSRVITEAREGLASEMEEILITSDYRVAHNGEVFTPKHIVSDMLDLVKDESYRLDATFLEPACGNGNFLVQILERKLATAASHKNYDLALFISVSTIYAIDIMEKNIKEAKARLWEIIDREYINKTGGELKHELRATLKVLLDTNIVQGDSLTGKHYDGSDIVIAEWKIEGDTVIRTDTIFNSITTPMQIETHYSPIHYMQITHAKQTMKAEDRLMSEFNF